MKNKKFHLHFNRLGIKDSGDVDLLEQGEVKLELSMNGDTGEDLERYLKTVLQDYFKSDTIHEPVAPYVYLDLQIDDLSDESFFDEV